MGLKKTTNLADGKERSYKSILFEILPQAVQEERSQTGRLDARGLFYACRRLYLYHPERPYKLEARLSAQKKNPEHTLEYAYFNGTILPEYEREYGEIDGLTRDARGHLHQAHLDEIGSAGTEVGTEFVRDFEPPDYYYDKILYVEKHGIALGLIDQRLGQRHDLAVVASKGYATEADRRLLQRFHDDGYQIFTLHDCDIDGYGIRHCISNGNARMPDLDVAVIDIGLSVEDARSFGMIGEVATRQKAIPQTTLDLLTPEEAELFTGRQRNSKVWEYKRYELNEIPSAERLPFVEAQLQANGVRPKVIPPDSYLADKAADVRDSDIRAEVSLAIDEIVDLDGIERVILDDFRDRYDLSDLRQEIQEGFARSSRASWRALLKERVASRGAHLRSDIREAVREEIEGRIDTSDEE
jgi:hypothetical protein